MNNYDSGFWNDKYSAKGLLYSVNELKEDFKALRFKYLSDESIYLNESENYCGEANVIRLLAEKVQSK